MKIIKRTPKIVEIGRIMWYALKAVEPPAERRWGLMAEMLVMLIISVVANVVSHFICGWLDGKERQQQPKQNSSL